MRKLQFLLIVFIFSTIAFAQAPQGGFDLANYGVRIEPDKRVMTVLATLEAARQVDQNGDLVPVIKTPLSADGEKFRETLKSDLASLDEPLRQKISMFLIQYKRRNAKATDAEIVAPFISMAYALAPAPELSDPIVTSDLPGNLLDVLDFAPLVREFYRRSSFSANLPEYLKIYQQSADATLRTSARDMVSEVLGYLRTRPQLVFAERIKTETKRSNSKRTTLKSIEVRERERRFFIVPEMLAPSGTINFLNVRDDYFAVVPPGVDLGTSGIRRAYLQFVIDPIVLNNSKEIAGIRDSIKTLIENRRKTDPSISPDVYLTISRSLVAAIEAKQNENTLVSIATQQARSRIDRAASAGEKAAISRQLDAYVKAQADERTLRLSENYENGALLSFYFADQLAGVENAGFDIAASVREMILSFDPSKEVARYEQFADARKRALDTRAARKSASSAAPALTESPVTARLRDIEKTINTRDLSQAESELKALLRDNPNEPRIFYNLGRVASFSAESLTDPAQQAAKLKEAKSNYENVIKLGQRQQVDVALASLTYVALGKIYEFFDEKPYAVALYDKALQLGRVTGGAFDEALAAKQRILAP